MKTAFVLAVTVLTTASKLAAAQLATCLPPPMLAVSNQAPFQLSLNVAGAPGINYAIEQSDDFSKWTRIATNRSESGTVTFSHLISLAAPEQYFRALSVDSSDGLGGSFIFDGETFAGWEGDTVETFRISDCAIVGGSFVRTFPQNRFLCTTQRYTNFILRLDFKLVGTNGTVNSGVQFRSERVPGSQEVKGFQADIGEGYWGSLYDEARRGVVLAAANQNSVTAILRKNDWNQYLIKAEGPHLQFWVNGYQTIDYTETDAAIPRDGIIGLQVHAGGSSEASFRYISLEVLP